MPIAPAELEDGEDRPGGDGTIDRRDSGSFEQPIPGLDVARLGSFEDGRQIFEIAWTVGGLADRDGLGPTYIGTSCESCHFRGSRGAPPAPGQRMVSMLMRLSIPDEDDGWIADPRYGDQIQTLGASGVPAEAWFSVAFASSPGTYHDGAGYELLAPTYEAHDVAFGAFAPDTAFSPRIAQPLHGLGLLGAIDEVDLALREDPDDLDGDGVSGRRNLVPHLVSGEMRTGRFGWKANQPDLEQQIAAALHGDMGITSPMFPEDGCPAVQTACAAAATPGPDIDTTRFEVLSIFSHLIAVPYRPDADEPEVLLGKAVFAHAGCTSCHTPSWTTGSSDAFSEIADQTIWPYTDLLLHDLGPGLADGRPDHDASGSEFRTPPLWGLGVTELVGGQRRLLHDGRARTVEEAILWHGGEADAAREIFRGLRVHEREALVRFVDSL
jgi:CxxC motif-containing protein (DUF1111 family)